ncbi:MAG: MurR/RpiR family transcriptional regulator [Candidatus Marinimicrobia bacterium]|nr:MurR/RpiR family transcriptional regulator [Candidatus Neomarinimicrobiota bacterium]MCF7828307.1 MurR/RpiR family transcriptional regulator [Candidatus Neomarinimicrobiota bacterium]MCF7879518.1 MurR/RpiR family transcriptional regulator [Candidatus Neomarinimicrobiota bacterium]
MGNNEISKNNHTNILLKLRGIRDGLNSAEQRLADYILEHPEDTVLFTIQELENKSGTSYATIIRFTKKLGFNGYKEFRNTLIRDVTSDQEEIEASSGFPIELDDNIETIIEKTFQNSVRILNETRRIIEVDVLQEAAERISNTRELVTIGTGASGIIARYAYIRFFRLGIPTTAETDMTLVKIKASLLDEDDVLLAVSSSGRSEKIVEAARLASDRGAHVISLCDYAVSPLSKIAEYPLFTTPRNAAQFLDIDMPLTTAQMNLIDILFLYTSILRGEDAFEKFQKTKDVSDSEKIQ